MIIQIDRWEQDEIESNLHDYINNAVLRVDKVSGFGRFFISDG